MQPLPPCPQCQSEYTYEDGALLICPECAYEWSADAKPDDAVQQVKDAHGNVLQDGDTVTVIKDLKVKGASSDVKVGTKIKGIKLNVTSDHNIDCKIPGFGAMGIKSEFVKRVQ